MASCPGVGRKRKKDPKAGGKATHGQTMTTEIAREKQPKVGLFVTCLVDLYRPSVGFATLDLLRQAGFDVEIPEAQTCCGQPGYNGGDRAGAKQILRRWVELFRSFDYVVVPSGSCAGMIRNHMPILLQDDATLAKEAQLLAARTYELTQFLAVMNRGAESVRHKDDRGISSAPSARLVYHDSCSSLRELKVREEPRALLRGRRDLELCEIEDADSCCGFGGSFCLKFPAISKRIVEEKVAAILAASPDMVTGADLGCLLNIANALARKKSRPKVFHVAEILAGREENPAIGEKGKRR